MRKFVRISAILLVVCFTSAAFGQGDIMSVRSGSPLKGEVKAMTPVKVTIKARGVDREIAVNEIKALTYGDDPLEMKSARSNIRDGNYGGALEQLKRIDFSSLRRRVVQQDYKFYVAMCNARLALAGTGDKAQAAGMMNKFRNDEKGSYHYLEATEIMGDLALGMGKYEVAATLYTQYGKAPWPEYKMRANVLSAQALMAQKKYKEAYSKYQAVVASPVKGTEADRQKALANLGTASCLAQAPGGAKKGIALAKKVLESADPTDTELYARAYNAMGTCYGKSGQSKDALLAFLHTDILFYSQPEAHAEALFHLASLWETVNKRDRAVKARNLLKSRYPDSRWAK